MFDSMEILDQGSGPAVLCLHGFPQNMSAYDQIASQLVQAGLRVIRYNQRGYTRETSGGRRRDYTMSKLAADAISVLDECDVESCIIVGHDLGATVAWEVERAAPSRVVSLVIVGAPHPGAFILSLVSPRQIASSWYFVLAQSTCLTKALYSPAKSGSRERLARFLEKSGLSASESQPYLDYLRAGNVFVGAVRWYQAMPFSPLRLAFFRTVKDVHIIVGGADYFSGGLSIAFSRLFVSPGRLKVTRVDGGTHWLLDQQPDVVAAAIVTQSHRDDR